mgnify:CR=1 FL=1
MASAGMSLRKAVRYALMVMALGVAVDATADTPKPAVVIADPAGRCVAPNDVMRRTHMDMLKHQRDRTVRQGIRGEKASLGACVDCHASKTTNSVLGAEGFCQSCHSYAAVKPDCFDCHSAKARRKDVMAGGERP